MTTTARTETENVQVHSREEKKVSKYKWEIVWHMVFKLLYIHISGLYGLYLCLFYLPLKVFFITLLYGYVISTGVTIGAHRLYSHKAMKANLPLRYVLNILIAAAMQNTTLDWVKDHRVHHKYTDTDADPHNASRGFFFSHMGWLLIRKHPDVKRKGKLIDMSDITEDPAVQFQLKYFKQLAVVFGIVLPTVATWFVFGIPLVQSYHLQMMRYMVLLHATWSVNSFAHLYGYKPYDTTIKPAQNLTVALVTCGEGWHNYHHVFPWDYRTDELSGYVSNVNKGIIELFARLGWMSDLKFASKEMINKRMQRTGAPETSEKTDVWGWDDGTMNLEDMKNTKILYKVA